VVEVEVDDAAEAGAQVGDAVPRGHGDDAVAAGLERAADLVEGVADR
jgi:hypothetical protein